MPAHPPPVRLQFLQRCARDGPEHHVVVGQVDYESVEPVRDRRARTAAGAVLGPEHEMVDEQLRATSKQVRQRGVALIGVESILLVDLHPGQLLLLPRHLIAAPSEVLFRLQ